MRSIIIKLTGEEMGAKEIDKIFRQKLKSEESPLPIQGWELLEQRLDEKPKAGFIWWRIAAIFLVLFGVVMTFYFWKNETGHSVNEFKEFALISVDPSENACDEENSFPIPVSMTQTQVESINMQEKTSEKSVKKEEISKVKALPKVEVKQVIQKKPVDEQLIEKPKFVEKIEDQILNEVEEKITAPVMKPMKIRITYKRGHESIANNEMLAKQEPDSATSKLKNMFASARDIKPGNLMADIRDVKNDFFARSSSTRNNNVKNLNK